MQIIFKLGGKHGHAERKKMPIYQASLVYLLEVILTNNPSTYN